MKPINILITNDDGIHAEGIQILSQAFFEEGPRYNLSVVAPDRERSAIGHAITMHRPLLADKVNFQHNPRLSGWSVNGTPSDCVKLAIEAILDKRPDIVISGINRGSNLGTDVLYSGTVSAAVEGLVQGVPSVAVSLTEGKDCADFTYAARFMCRFIAGLLEHELVASTLLNINIPPGGENINGARITKLGTRRYRNTFEERIDPRGRSYYWLAGELVEDDPEDELSDTRAIKDNYVSITPIHFELTNQAAVAPLQQMLAKMGLFPL